MRETTEIQERGVAEEMAAYIGVAALAKPSNTPPFGMDGLILLLATDGFTAHEINEHMDRALSLVLH